VEFYFSDTLTIDSQIEKEALALITVVERFHNLLWSRHFILQTNYLALFNTKDMKGLSERTSARLKHWALRLFGELFGYDFDIEYVKTEEFGKADALSR